MYDVTCNYTYYVVSKIFCQLQITLPTATQWGSEYGCGSKSSPFAQLSGCPMLPTHSTPSLLGHFGLPKIETSGWEVEPLNQWDLLILEVQLCHQKKSRWMSWHRHRHTTLRASLSGCEQPMATTAAEEPKSFGQDVGTTQNQRMLSS